MKRRMVPIYNLPAYFTDNEKDCAAFVKRHGGKEEDAGECLGCVLVFRGDSEAGYLIMAVYDGDIGTTAHESVHAAWNLLAVCGVKIDSDNDEPLAFLSAWFLKTMLRLYPIDKPKVTQIQEIA